jgi:hypothetical protein
MPVVSTGTRANTGYAVAQLVEALRYKPEGHAINPRWSLRFFIGFILPAPLWPLPEISTRNLSWG